MTIKIRVHGLKYFERMMRSKKMQLGKGVQSVLVGYGGDTADYAIYVHNEDRPGIDYTTPGTGPQFLAEPAQANMDNIRDIVSQGLKDGKTLIDSLFKAGEFVLEESQSVTPRDSGALRESGFVERESGNVS